MKAGGLGNKLAAVSKSLVNIKSAKNILSSGKSSKSELKKLAKLQER